MDRPADAAAPASTALRQPSREVTERRSRRTSTTRVAGARRGVRGPRGARRAARGRARRCSTASSAATRATARSATRSRFASGTIAGRISRCLARLREISTHPMAELPSGTVTFLFTDIEGSTRAAPRARGRSGTPTRSPEHRRVLREAFDAHGGVEVDTQGDAFFYAFVAAPAAAAAAWDAQEALADGSVQACEWDCTPGTPIAPARATWATTCTSARGWPLRPTAARSCSCEGDLRAARRRSCRDLGEHRAEGTSTSRSGSTSSATASSRR